MAPDDPLRWPFFAPHHRELALRVDSWARSSLRRLPVDAERAGLDTHCRRLVAALGAAGFLRYGAPHADGDGDGDAAPTFDVRAIALLRERLAWHDALADFACAMQGLGSGAITLAGAPALRARYLPGVAAGTLIAAFALSEPEAGSDVAALRCSARRDGEHYLLDGDKTWISNGGIADFYCVFARTEPASPRADGSVAARGISAFVVDAATPGLEIAERIDVMAPHPLARLHFRACRVPAAQRLGAEGDGFQIAMRTLDVFRATVAAAALGLAQRALDEALRHARERLLFGKRLADFQLTQAALADMATELEAARLLTYRAAWLRDQGASITRAAAMAKLAATEAAQRVIDRGLQMFGGRGVVSGQILERLYRDVRALRIYEGASEVQKLIIARELLKSAPA
jgi:acyl-CoA dehydrogenase